ncbi:MAG: FAD-dependent oxidoreductase [Deltaproteobacteria bacterium]|nr:FAD-dependent oxidoreductase [Deltaproteobacteria bacterium]
MTKGRVLVLGGGFGGVEGAIHLSRAGFDVTLVSERDFAYLYPVSIWIPTGEIDFDDACLDLLRISSRYRFKLLRGKVTGIDPEGCRVEVDGDRTDSFDFMLIALGGAKMKPAGVEHTLSICGRPKDSLEIKKRVEALIAGGGGRIAVGFGGNPKDPSAVRGGPAFEQVFNLHHFFVKKGWRNSFSLTMFAPMEKPGIRLGEGAVEKVYDFLNRMKIDRRFGVKITRFEEGGVVFADDSRLESDLTLFIPAGTGLPLFREAGLPLNDAGFIRIDPSCRVEGTKRIFAVGDSAAIDGPKWRAKQGHLAEAMARVAAANIRAAAAGRDPEENYIDHVSILCVMDYGNGAAVVHRSTKRSFMVPLPIVGHLLKKSWGLYWKLTKTGRIMRLPGF